MSQHQQRGTASAEIKVPCVENAELSKVRPMLEPGVGQDMALHAPLTAMNFSLTTFYRPLCGLILSSVYHCN